MLTEGGANEYILRYFAPVTYKETGLSILLDFEMNLYEEFNKKQIRTITRDLNLTFSLKGFSFPKTINEIREIDFLGPKIKVNNNEIYLSKKGRIALRRICDFISQSKKFNNLLNYNDIFKGILKEVERWANDNLAPDASEFISHLDEFLSNRVNNYLFFCRVDGISFKEIRSVVIGNKQIKSYTSETLADISDISDAIKDIINKEYDKSLVIFGFERGSQSVAQKKFYHNAELSLSILRLYSCALYSQAIHKVNIRLINNCQHSYGPASSFGWVESEKNLIFTRYLKREQDFEIDEKLLDRLNSECFFKEISTLIDKE